ncbi:TetR/AcrR family transcriptional regulator [Streptomyces sp. G-G2]|uniref:TetR/AcrR family transcriptional regulator n=1 Tax=Streptomyces sp. G-G2 TaxID=3046201 RepID=UPI0024B8B3E2|nr:TetR/AcrR family transcriptional regulator [Streptomyces sp. G-G2]MDJ0381192.1 TetR/AcrR family transcriptional regulator [Streptomyces sp. G-G2]
MSTVRGARERARIEITAAIKDEARRQLAAEGAARLSLRAVARELGMVSSALYRYFPSRDDLLTALIVDAYDSLGAAAEAAYARTAQTATGAAAPGAAGRASAVGASANSAAGRAAGPGGAATATPREQWVEVCGAVRGWALAHPHEYALIYGSPVPGYSAPASTIGPASRVGNTLIAIARAAYEGPGLALPPLPPGLRSEATRMTEDFATGLPPAVAPALVAAWAQLVGLISFELFGQFHRVVEERDAFFAHAAGQLAHGVGLLAT